MDSSIKGLMAKLRLLNEEITILDDSSVLTTGTNGVRFIHAEGERVYKSDFYKSITPYPEYRVSKLESLKKETNNNGVIDYTGVEKIAPIYRSIQIVDRFIIAKLDSPVFLMDTQCNMLVPTIHKDCRNAWKYENGTCIFTMTTNDRHGETIYSIDGNNKAKQLFEDKEVLILAVTENEIIIAYNTNLSETDRFITYDVKSDSYSNELTDKIDQFSTGHDTIELYLKDGSVTEFKTIKSILK